MEGKQLPIITISRQMYSFGDEIAEALSRKLGWELLTRNALITRFCGDDTTDDDRHMLTESAKYYLKPSNTKVSFIDVLTSNLEGYLTDHSAILVGFGSQMIFAQRRDAVHVRIFAPKEIRVNRAKKHFHVTKEEAESIIDVADKKHRKFVSTVFGADLCDPANYHLALNTALLSVDECVTAILALQKEHEFRRQIEIETSRQQISSNLTDCSIFKTEAEAEFAKILDMYQLDWKYEPKTFPIEWDAEGNVTMAFSPDFYLTKFDLYIELTTMNQKYVTLKNKKAKKLRELYPGINVKVMYKKDFNTLMERFK
ncbi:MAG TPA: cytidylate kinase family protein [Negativicutes bacterium]|nr:cytidylate kinase family protein [Negativicutes bacterium]